MNKIDLTYSGEIDGMLNAIENKKLLVDMLNNNYTYDKIADELGIAKGTVFNYIKKFNIIKIYK